VSGALDVNWDHLICQNQQLNALKISIRIAAVRRVCRPSRYVTLRTTAIREANARRRHFTESRMTADAAIVCVIQLGGYSL
jgi:hypothetical protein